MTRAPAWLAMCPRVRCGGDVHPWLPTRRTRSLWLVRGHRQSRGWRMGPHIERKRLSSTRILGGSGQPRPSSAAAKSSSAFRDARLAGSSDTAEEPRWVCSTCWTARVRSTSSSNARSSARSIPRSLTATAFPSIPIGRRPRRPASAARLPSRSYPAGEPTRRRLRVCAWAGAALSGDRNAIPAP